MKILPSEVPLTPNGRAVLERRYLRRDEGGGVAEAPEDLFARVARNIAGAEEAWGGSVSEWEERFYRAMTSLDFLPNSPTLMNAGRELQQLAACFVLPIEDSLDSIFETLKLTAKIHQSGGGTGFSFSHIRPRGDLVRTTMGIASGPISFLEVYDAATERIKQGSFRRGANMGILDVTHPDIREFIDLKRSGAVTNFNISVGVTQEWMEKVAAGGSYDLINPRTGSPMRTTSAREVFDQLVDAAWETGDPGIVFLDRINEPRTNPTPFLGRIEATNPCGETPLLPFEACVLGSINLQHHVSPKGIDWARIGATVHLAVRFLDDAVECSRYPLPQIESIHKRGNRKIGVGVMGWADLLVRMAISYDSDEAVELAGRLMAFVQQEADAASAALAAERGPFANWERSIYGPGGSNRPLRNATRTTIAPTGSISIIAGCSSGIEPLFALSYYRQVLDGKVLTEVNPDFERVAKERGVWSDEVASYLLEHGGCRGLELLPGEMRAIFATAHEIEREWHIKHQAAFQRHVDNAVSKTINLPHRAERRDVGAAYRLAYELGCKGITVYRDRSKRWQVLNLGRPSGTDIGTMEGSPPAPEEDKPLIPPERGQNVLEICPLCGQASFEFAETCGKCHSCGHSTC